MLLYLTNSPFEIIVLHVSFPHFIISTWFRFANASQNSTMSSQTSMPQRRFSSVVNYISLFGCQLVCTAEQAGKKKEKTTITYCRMDDHDFPLKMRLLVRPTVMCVYLIEKHCLNWKTNKQNDNALTVSISFLKGKKNSNMHQCLVGLIKIRHNSEGTFKPNSLTLIAI